MKYLGWNLGGGVLWDTSDHVHLNRNVICDTTEGFLNLGHALSIGIDILSGIWCSLWGSSDALFGKIDAFCSRRASGDALCGSLDKLRGYGDLLHGSGEVLWTTE